MRKSSQAHLVVIQPVAAPVQCPRAVDDCGMRPMDAPEPDLE